MNTLQLKAPNIFLTLLLLLAQAPLAYAGTSVAGSLAQNVAVANSCVIRTTDNINFGNYDPTSGLGPQGSGSIQLSCTKGTTATAIPVTGGQMTGPGGVLNYVMYVDSGLTQVWGAPGAINDNVDFSKGINFVNLAKGLTYQQCQTLSNGLMFAYANTGQSYGDTSTYCYTNYSTVSANHYSLSGVYNFSNNLGLNISGVTLVGASGGFINKQWVTQPTIYTPSGTLVTGHVYSVPTALSGAQGISMKSTSVLTTTSLTYYGRVPPNQDVSPGMYMDTVVLQVSF